MEGEDEPGIAAKLAVRNLLRGYQLRMPTGQAVARALQEKLEGVRDIPVLTLQEVLGDIEIRLEAYLVEGRRLLGIENKDPRPASSQKSGVRQTSSGRRSD